MYYNLYIHIPIHGVFNVMEITKEQVEVVIEAYKRGDSNFTLNGTKYDLHNVKDFQIYEMSMKMKFTDFKKSNLYRGLLKQGGFYGRFIPKENLEKFGDCVTSNFLGNLSFGEEIIEKTQQNNEFISSTRLDELHVLSSSNFDYQKLIRLCEELNDNFSTFEFRFNKDLEASKRIIKSRLFINRNNIFTEFCVLKDSTIFGIKRCVFCFSF